MRRPCPPILRHQKGYILALNIVVLAVMLAGATYIGQRMSLAKVLARAEQQREQDDVALESARAKVLFLLATVPRGKHGLGNATQTVALDGRYYRVANNILVSLQDTYGLIGANTVDFEGNRRGLIERLLGSYGLDNIGVNRLTDILLDYRDVDDFRRINGAEREQYRSAGQESLIRNGDLLTPIELGRVLSWSDNPQLWNDDPVTDYVHIQHSSLFNPNSASWRALVAMTGIPHEIARNLVERRQRGEIADISRLVFSGDINDPFGLGSRVSLFPSASIQVTLRKENSTWGYRMLATHTPSSRASPWHIEYAHKISLKPLISPLDKVPLLPEAAMLRDSGSSNQVQLPF